MRFYFYSNSPSYIVYFTWRVTKLWQIKQILHNLHNRCCYGEVKNTFLHKLNLLLFPLSLPQFTSVQLQGVRDHLDQLGVEWEDQERDGGWGGDRVGRHHLLDGDHPCRAGVWDQESAKMFYSCIFLSQCVLCIKNNDFYNLENYFLIINLCFRFLNLSSVLYIIFRNMNRSSSFSSSYSPLDVKVSWQKSLFLSSW